MILGRFSGVLLGALAPPLASPGRPLDAHGATVDAPVAHFLRECILGALLGHLLDQIREAKHG